MLAKPAFRALILTAAAAMPAALIGCGAQDATNPTGVTSGSVNPDDPKSWDDFLRSIDVAPAPREDLGTERSSPKRGAFLIYPVGEVRKVGLKSFRVDVTTDFDAKGTLRFTKGSKTLYEGPFDPAALTKETFVATLPSAVLETVSAGDSVKWGLWFDDAKVKPVTATFKVIDKAQATKEIAKKIDANRSLASTPAVRELARAEILLNYSLYSEAVEVLTTVAASDDRLQAPYMPLANALRRLKLKESPLFQEAMLRAVAGSSNRRLGGPGDPSLAGGGAGVDPTGLGGHASQAAKSSTTPVAKSAGNAPKGLHAGGSVPAGIGGTGSQLAAEEVPSDAKDAWNAYLQAYAGLRARVEAARQHAAEMQHKADEAAAKASILGQKAQEAQSKVADLQQKLAAAQQALNANPNDPALAQEVVSLNEQLQAAQQAAEEAQKLAMKAQHDAEVAAKAAEDAKKAADMAALTVAPGAGPMPPPPTDTTQGTSPSLAQATQAMEKAWQNAAAANQALEAALQTLTAADEALAAAGTPDEVAAAALAREQAFAAYQAAEQAAAEAAAAVENAENMFKKVSNAQK